MKKQQIINYTLMGLAVAIMIAGLILKFVTEWKVTVLPPFGMTMLGAVNLIDAIKNNKETPTSNSKTVFILWAITAAVGIIGVVLAALHDFL